MLLLLLRTALRGAALYRVAAAAALIPHCVVLQSRFLDSTLGRVQIPVADVARNGCLKDTWALLVSDASVCCILSIELHL